ncbi:MAG: S9 family peptidase, partial [Bdellovibrionales bacterium]|nr:S9 family peptidase [Bdellovibrionales bacterium]
MYIKTKYSALLLFSATATMLIGCQTGNVSNNSRCVAGKTDSTKESEKCVTQLASKDPKDPENLYLEEVYGKKALGWVEAHNESSRPQFENDTRFSEIKSAALKVMDDPNKMIHVAFSGDWAYNFWQDEKNVRGLWRRTSIENYLSGERKWEVLLDIDALAKKENKNWIFGGSNRFKDRALIYLSDGGKDAKVVREFDIPSKSFVSDGFILPEGKNAVSWINEDEVFLGLAIGEDEATDSGYPRQTRIWKRGESYKKAKVVYSGDKKDVSVSAGVSRDEEDSPARYKIIKRGLDFFNTDRFILRDDGKLVKLEIPTDASLNIEIDQAFVTLKSDWVYQNKTYKVGSLIKFDLEQFISGSIQPEYTTFAFL